MPSVLVSKVVVSGGAHHSLQRLVVISAVAEV